MFDDFWQGYNYGSDKQRPQSKGPVRFSETTQQMAESDRQKRASGVYDKSKFTRMTGPMGEQGEVYANGKMYIVSGPGKNQVRTFPSRPFGVRYMQQKGWVLA